MYHGLSFLFLKYITSITDVAFHFIQRMSFVCEVCGRGYRSKQALNGHRTHHGERKFSCLSCEKKFFTKQELVQNLYSHGSAKNYICHECDQAFKYSTGLHRHRRCHFDSDQYKCDVCNAAFLRKDCPKDHVRKHADPWHLARHTQRFSSKKSAVPCPTCGKKFKEESYIKDVHAFYVSCVYAAITPFSLIS